MELRPVYEDIGGVISGFSGEWKEQQLGSVITHCFSGATPYRGHPEFYNGDIRWITSGELNYNVITDTKEKITKDAVIRTNLKILPKGTFLMAITGLEAEGTRGSCGIGNRSPILLKFFHTKIIK